MLRPALVLLITIVFTFSTFSQEKHKRALLVIDVQENLVNPNSRIHIDTTNINVFFSNINKTVDNFNNSGDDVIYVVNEWTNPFMNWATGNVCKKGSPGVGLDKRLNIINNKIYSKSKSNSLTNLELRKYLVVNKITDIYLVGLLAEGCVKATAEGLKAEKFNVTVLKDALGSKSTKNKEKAIAWFLGNDIKMLTTTNLN